MVAWPEGGAPQFERRFAEHLAVVHDRRHVEDYQIAVRSFASDRPRLIDWFGAVLEPFERVLTFEDGAPILACGSLGDWRRVTARIDPDTLVALQLSMRMPSGMSPEACVARLPGWGFYVGSGDHGLRRVLSRGTADIHVHFEASDPLPLLWLRLTSGRVGVHELQFFSKGTLEQLKEDRREHHNRIEDRDILGAAALTRAALADALDRPVGREDDDRNSSHLTLVAERELLVAAWRRLRLLDEERIAQLLDDYVYAKSLFLRRHQQRAGQGAGLTRFRDYLDRGETIGERRTKRTKPSVRKARFERMLSLAAEPPSLRMLELRIAPQNTLRGWFDFFSVWSRVLADRREEWSSRGLVVRFVVHFIRKADRSRGRADVGFGSLRQVIDRQSAVLQLFRHRCPDLARHIVGVDVANLERACPPEVFSPYLHLLRGSGEVDMGSEPFMEFWRRLRDRDQHLPPAELPTLGVTYHAGEDFHHPVDGLRDIDGLIGNLLRPGDRIGHGLAVGWDVARFERDRGAVPLPAGFLLDDLIWLRRESAACGEWCNEWQIEGDKTIDELASRIHGRVPTRRALEHSLDLRYRIPRRRDRRASSTLYDDGLSAETVFDPEVANARSRFASSDQVRALSLATPILKGVQERLARKIRNTGLVVEANPTSNVVTGAVPRLAEHPFFAYGKALGGQVIVTLNTDDPGVFGTTLEIEYGLMLEAMLENGFDRIEALRLLDDARLTAIDNAFGKMKTSDIDLRRFP